MAIYFKNTGITGIGFNYWMVILPLLIVLAAIIGYKRYYLVPRSLRIVRKYGDEALEKIGVVLAAVFGVAVLIESYWGLVQFSINHLADSDSVTYGFIMPVFLAFGAFLLLSLALMFVIKAASYFKYKKLVERRAHIRRKRRLRKISEEDEEDDLR